MKTAEDFAGGCGSMNPAFLMQPPLFTNSLLTGDFGVVFWGGNINMYVCVFIIHVCVYIDVHVCVYVYTL